MNDSYSISGLISMYYEDLFSGAEEVEPPRLSFRHKIKMKKVFSEFQKNKSKSASLPIYAMKSNTHISVRSIRKHSLAFLMIAFIAVGSILLTGTMRVYNSPSFYGTIFPDYTRLHTNAADADTYPIFIEKEYYLLSVLPEGYELVRTFVPPEEKPIVCSEYENKATGQYVVFDQEPKNGFVTDVNTEKYKMYPAKVNEHDAVYVQFNYRDIPVETLLIWNSDEYILSLSGTGTKDELIALASANERNGFIKVSIED